MTTEKVSQAESVSRARLWIARFFVFFVFLSNLSAAIPFVWDPARYVSSFEVQGVVGEVVVRSIGVLFIMWIVPYVPAILNPVQYRVCLVVILAQQCIGLMGESWMWFVLPAGHESLRATGTRYILFDATGLLFLGIAWLVTRVPRKLF